MKNLSLYKKGVIIVALPLIFGLGTAGTMLVLEQFYEKKVEEETRLKEIISHANNIYTWCIEIVNRRLVSRMLSADVIYSSKEEDEQKHRVSSEYKTIRRLIGGGINVDLRKLNGIRSNANAALQNSSLLEPITAPNMTEEQRLQHTIKNWDVLKKMFVPMHALGEAYTYSIVNQESNVTMEVTAANDIIRDFLTWVLGLNLAGSCLLFAFFIKSIYSGINGLMKNTDLFRQGAKLTPALERTDEIGQMDRSFHNMVSDIHEAARMKQEILAVVSHDLRTPLTSVTAYFSSLSGGVYGEASAEIKQAAALEENRLLSMIQLINEILDLEKIDARKFQIAPRMVYIEHLMEESINDVVQAALRKYQTIKYSDTDLECFADPVRLKQVLMSLIQALISSSKDGAAINLSGTEHDGQSVIRIESNSIDKQTITGEDLFIRNSYKQSETKADLTTDFKQMTRLSLPLAAELVKLHDGELHFKCEPDDLAYFQLSLPLPRTIEQVPTVS